MDTMWGGRVDSVPYIPNSGPVWTFRQQMSGLASEQLFIPEHWSGSSLHELAFGQLITDQLSEKIGKPTATIFQTEMERLKADLRKDEECVRFIAEILERKRGLTFSQISEIRIRVWSDGQGRFEMPTQVDSKKENSK